MLTDWLNRVFGPPEEINGGLDQCPTFLLRWTLLKPSRRFSVYLHHFVGDDFSRDLHDHPKRFVSIGLKGWYIEERPCFERFPDSKRFPPEYAPVCRIFRAPWIRTFPATHIHRIRVPSKDCWTLVIALKPVREWGFWPGGRWVNWRAYVESKGADKIDC